MSINIKVPHTIPSQCWPVFLKVALEHRNAPAIMERVMGAESPEIEAKVFLGEFFQDFGRFIARKKSRTGRVAESQLGALVQMFGDTYFQEYLRTR